MTLIGEVISTKMEKTVVVEVSRRVMHPIYKKYMTTKKKFMAHDEHGKCIPGDKVKIIASRPISKLKRWRISKIVEKSESL